MVAQLNKQYLLTRPGRAVVRLMSYALYEGRPLTTRGRWINPYLQRRFAKLAGAGAQPAPDRPLFILGTGRSGTTILGQILSLHRDVGWLNEPKLMWHVACPDEDLNGNYTDAPAHYRLDENAATPHAITAMRNIYHDYLRKTGSQRVLDKYPELLFRLPFVKAIFPDARFILLVRDGIDTCRSISTWSANHGTDDASGLADWWGTDRRKWYCLVDELVSQHPRLGPHAAAIRAFRTQTDMAAVEWLLTMQEGLQRQQLYGDDLLLLRYEDLTAEPREALSNLFGFCELSSDDTVLDYADNNLRHSAPKPSLQLHRLVQDEFTATMHALGYRCD